MPGPLKTLFVVFNRIGDLTTSTPLYRALARDRELSLLTRPFGVALLGSQSYLERVYALRYPNRGRSRLGNLFLGGHRRALGRELRGAGFDEVLIYAGERPVIKRWLDVLFPGRVTEIPQSTPPASHVAERYREAAAHLGCDMERYEADPVLDITAASRAEATRTLALLAERGEQGPHREAAEQGPHREAGERGQCREAAEPGHRVVGIQMGSQRTSDARWVGSRPDLKTLSTRQWGALITQLLDEGHADAVALHGAPGETKMVGALLRTLPETIRRRCHDLSATVGLDLLPALLASHYALISVDTGPAHIAAAVGCPVLVFFGPTDPAVFRPRGKGPIQLLTGEASCQFCHRTPLYKTCRDNRCLNRLPDDRLWEAWMALRGQVNAISPVTC